MNLRSFVRGAIFLLVAFLGGVAGSWIGRPGVPQASTVEGDGPGSIVGTFGVGGVVLRDGHLWQFRPDKKRWVSLDESFALEGQATNTVPLPVPVSQIRFMETFGFLVTQEDRCWLYDIEQHRWQTIGSPPAGK